MWMSENCVLGTKQPRTGTYEFSASWLQKCLLLAGGRDAEAGNAQGGEWSTHALAFPICAIILRDTSTEEMARMEPSMPSPCVQARVVLSDLIPRICLQS